MRKDQSRSANYSLNQPSPQHNQGPAVWDLVVADMIERDQVGQDRYGTRLQPDNGRDTLVDMYQEELDKIAYLRQFIEERKTLWEQLKTLRASVVLLSQGKGDIATVVNGIDKIFQNALVQGAE